jgi:hypothetical protein
MGIRKLPGIACDEDRICRGKAVKNHRRRVPWKRLVKHGKGAPRTDERVDLPAFSPLRFFEVRKISKTRRSARRHFDILPLFYGNANIILNLADVLEQRQDHGKLGASTTRKPVSLP